MFSEGALALWQLSNACLLRIKGPRQKNKKYAQCIGLATTSICDESLLHFLCVVDFVLCLALAGIGAFGSRD